MATVYCDTAGATTANCGLTLDLWMKPLQARLSGATEGLVRCELNAAVREFYLQSNAWREQIGPYNIYQGQDVVWLNPVDAYSMVTYVRGAWIEDPETGRKVLQPMTIRNTDNAPGDITHYSTPDPYVLRLWRMPEESMGAVLWIDATLAPLPDATRLPNIAASHHFEPILEGALSRLLAMPNRPWSDPALGMRYSQTFRRRCVEWRSISGQGYNRSDAGWRYPAFA
jgi:hypothetical protein